MNTCCICLNEDENLILYNHCGTYYVHDKCINQCINTYQHQCFICREYIINIEENSTIENANYSVSFYILRCSLSLFLIPLLFYILYKFDYIY